MKAKLIFIEAFKDIGFEDVFEDNIKRLKEIKKLRV